jgi:hypothetical protein
MKISIFWNKSPCSPLKINRRFVGISLGIDEYDKEETSMKLAANKSLLSVCFKVVSFLA